MRCLLSHVREESEVEARVVAWGASASFERHKKRASTILPLSNPPTPSRTGNEYSKSDFRWNIFDPTVLSLELLTVLVAGPLALVIAWAIITNNKYRHPLQLIICVAEIYGGWMTFGPGTPYSRPNHTR